MSNAEAVSGQGCAWPSTKGWQTNSKPLVGVFSYPSQKALNLRLDRRKHCMEMMLVCLFVDDRFREMEGYVGVGRNGVAHYMGCA